MVVEPAGKGYVPCGGAWMATEPSREWIAEAWTGTRTELATFFRTAARFVTRPAEFGRKWTEGDLSDLNPLGFAATSFALVGLAGTALSRLFSDKESQGSLTNDVLSWLLPYAYFFILGVTQHLCLKLFRSRRPLRDSCAMALYAGGGAGLPTHLLGQVIGLIMKALHLPVKLDLTNL